MLNIDKLVMDFISQNWLTMSLAYVIANGIARITPFTWDEKIIQIFADVLERLKPSAKLNGNKPPDNPAPPIG